jgi:hypothetical protein
MLQRYLDSYKITIEVNKMAGRGRPVGSVSKTTALSSRRKKIKKTPLMSKTGVELDSCHCRRCMKDKKPTDFFDAVDFFLDTSGKMSICKSCCNDIYSRMYLSEHSMDKALLRCCRILNVRYDEDAVSTTQERVKKIFDEGRETENIFGIYKMSLSATQKTRITRRNIMEDMIFVEPVGIMSAVNPMGDDIEESFDIKQFWGDNFEYDDYVYLERELSEWKKTHKSDTKAEETLLKELCYKGLETRKARVEGRSTANLVKELQDLMKTASVDPAKTAIAGSGKSQDTFSSFIKTIEENEPADFYKDKGLFKDFDNIDFYFRKYVTRPLKNFITQSRDFNVETDDYDDSDEFLMDDKITVEDINNGNIPQTLQE